MRTFLVVTAVVVVAAGLAQTASGARPSTGHSLKLYLAKVKPLNAAVVVAETSLIKAQKAGSQGSNNTNPAVARKDLNATLLHSSKALKRIVPPTALKEAHAAFVSSFVLEAQRADTRANRLRREWRAAAIRELQRAGQAVPRWVKQVRDPFA
jgi:hypothetical protein